MPEISEELKIGNIDEKTLLELSYEKRLDSLREAKGDNWSLGPPMSKDEIKKEQVVDSLEIARGKYPGSSNS